MVLQYVYTFGGQGDQGDSETGGFLASLHWHGDEYLACPKLTRFKI